MIPIVVLWASLDAGASVSASALATLGRVIVLIPVVLLGHELAHAAATRLVGGRLYEISVGIGRTLARCRVRGVLVCVRVGLLDGGHCVAGFDSATPVALWRWFAIYAAGISFHAVAAAAGAIWIDAATWRWAFVLLNLGFVAVNLFPRRLTSGRKTDGLQLWELARNPAAEGERRAQIAAAAVSYALRAGDIEDAARLEAAASKAFPTSVEVRVTSILVHLCRGDVARVDEGVEVWRTLAPDPDPDAVERTLLLADLGGARWGDDQRVSARVMAGDHESALELVRTHLRDETHALAREYWRADAGLLGTLLATSDEERDTALDDCHAAFAVLPWSTRIGFTRATALALAHRDEHAVKAADQAAHYDLTDETPPNRRLVLALAAARGGDVARAARLLRPVPGLLLPPFMHRALADAACPIRPTRAA